jgi:hypothetical protein
MSYNIMQDQGADVQCLPGSESFEYILYQGREKSLQQLGYYGDQLEKIEGDKWHDMTVVEDGLQFVTLPSGRMDLRNGDGKPITGPSDIYTRYKIILDGEVVGGFIDPLCSYQTGDCATYRYLWKGTDLVIENCGDVSSVVVFRQIKP